MKYRNANIWVMSLYLSCLVFFVQQTVASLLQCLNMCLNIMIENESGFEFVFGKKINKIKNIKNQKKSIK